MSTTTLSNLLLYLYGTLTPQNMVWVGEHLISYAKKEQDKKLPPYTMDDINAMIDRAEEESAAGEFRSNEDVFKDLLSEEDLKFSEEHYEMEGCLA